MLAIKKVLQRTHLLAEIILLKLLKATLQSREAHQLNLKEFLELVLPILVLMMIHTNVIPISMILLILVLLLPFQWFLRVVQALVIKVFVQKVTFAPKEQLGPRFAH